MVEKVEVPLETKYKFAMGGFASAYKGFLELIREEYGAAAALKIYEKYSKKDDRIKNFTNTILTAFKIEGNDCETIGKFWDVWYELTGMKVTVLERSKAINRVKVTKCPLKMEYKDLSDFSLINKEFVFEVINPKATVERPKAMCEGDPYCEYIYKLEE